MPDNRSFPPAPMLSQRSSPSRVRSRRARERRALDRCGPLRLAPLGRKSNHKKISPSFSCFAPGPRLPPENIAPGSPTNDDLHLARPPASPVLSVLIAPPAESSTLIGVISRHKTHHKSAASGLLPWRAAELPDHGSAESGAADPHPRTTAVVGGARSR